MAPVAPSGAGPVQRLSDEGHDGDSDSGRTAFLARVPAMGIVSGEAIVPAESDDVAVSERSLSNRCVVAEWDDEERRSRSGRWSTTASCCSPGVGSSSS